MHLSADRSPGLKASLLCNLALRIILLTSTGGVESMWYDETNFRKVDDGYLYFADFGGAYRVTEHQKAGIIALSNWSALVAALTIFPSPVIAYWFGFGAGITLMAVPSLVFAVYRTLQQKRILRDAPRTNEKSDRTIGAVRERLRSLPRLMPWWNVCFFLGLGLCGIGASLYFGDAPYWDFLLKTLVVISGAMCVISICLAVLKLQHR